MSGPLLLRVHESAFGTIETLPRLFGAQRATRY